MSIKQDMADMYCGICHLYNKGPKKGQPNATCLGSTHKLLTCVQGSRDASIQWTGIVGFMQQHGVTLPMLIEWVKTQTPPDAAPAVNPETPLQVVPVTATPETPVTQPVAEPTKTIALPASAKKTGKHAKK